MNFVCMAKYVAEQGCIQKFCQGRANWGMEKKGGRKLTIVLCEAQEGV